MVTNQSVYNGVSYGVQKLLEDVNNFSKPEVVIDTIAASVMNELSSVLDFGTQDVRFTPDMLRQIFTASQTSGEESVVDK
jgi:hypothetical protein